MGMSNMGWIGGVINILASAGDMFESRKMAKSFNKAAGAGLPFLEGTAREMKDWGAKDWENFKTNYRPVTDALVTDANRAPDTIGAAGKVAADAAQSGGALTNTAKGAMFAHGIGPASGAFTHMLADGADRTAAAEGIVGAGAKLNANEEQTRKKLGLINLGRTMNDPTTMANAMGLVSAGGANYGKYSAAFNNRAAGAAGGIGQGVGQVIGSWNTKSGTRAPLEYGQDDKGNQANPEAGGDYWYAHGGLVRGPGTGTSDSVPAEIDGEHPARVSNGEYVIKAPIAQKIGIDRLNQIVAAARGQ